MPPSSMRCHRHARASAWTRVPSGCGFKLETMALPSGATIRLRPPRRWNRIGMRTTRVPPSSRLSMRSITPPSFRPVAAVRRPGSPVPRPRSVPRLRPHSHPPAQPAAGRSAPARRGTTRSRRWPSRRAGSRFHQGTFFIGSLVPSHSLSFDQRQSDWPPRTAIPTALRCPTITTRRLPRVTPV